MSNEEKKPDRIYRYAIAIILVVFVATATYLANNPEKNKYPNPEASTPEYYCKAQGYTGSADEQYADMTNNKDYAKCYKYTWEGPENKNSYNIAYGWVEMQ